VQHKQPLRVAGLEGEDAIGDASFKRFVTFYITNFPPQASTFFLQKGFEVCGILEDVFVANKRNINGKVFGFVCYAKVRDVDKLLKALNNVCFGHYNVCAKLARFDKKVSKVVEEVKEREGEGVKAVGSIEDEGSLGARKARKKEVEGDRSLRFLGREGEEVTKKIGSAKEGRKGKVRVGSVLVRLGRKSRVREGDGEKENVVSAMVKGRKETETDTSAPKKLVRCYRSCEDDINWAMIGLVGTVCNGESIPII